MSETFRRPSSWFVGVAVAVLATASLSIVRADPGATARAATPAAIPVTSSSPAWTTVFHDDFSGAAGSAIDGNWQYDTGTGYPGGAAQWGTGEVESATSSTANVYQDGSGHLVIKPIRDAAGQWTSGRVETQRTDFAAPAGGELEMSASIQQPDPSAGLGYWPAFWALGAAARPVAAADWPSVGELDVMEDVNALSQVSHTFHCGVWGQPPCNEPDGISSGLLACAGCQSAFHTYAVVLDRTDVNDEQLRFSTDGVVQFTVHQNAVDATTWANAVHHGFFMILDVAIDGSYPNKVCGCDSTQSTPTSGVGMKVDYVDVREAGATTAPTTTPPTTAAPTTAAPTIVPTTTKPPTAVPTTTKPTTKPPTTTPPTTTPSTTTSPTAAPTPGASVIQAENYGSQSGTALEATTDTGGGQDLGWIGDGDWTAYPGVDFGATSRSQFLVRVASGAAAGVSGLIQVRLDSASGPVIGSLAVASTGGWQSWRTVPANITPTTGVHTVYLGFSTGSGHDFVNVNWFEFAA